jgi:hypothetical protein
VVGLFAILGVTDVAVAAGSLTLSLVSSPLDAA